MNAASAVKLIRESAAAGHYWFTNHALDRMFSRQITQNDVVNGMKNATGCAWDSANASWVVPAHDADGDAFEIVIVLDATGVYVKAVVKTVF